MVGKRKKLPIIITIIVTLLLLMIILILGILSFRSTEAAAIKELNKRQLVLADKSTKEIEFYFSTIAREQNEISKEFGVQKFDEAVSREVLKEEVGEIKEFQIDDLSIIDKAGVIRYSANFPQMEGKNFSSEKYFKEAKRATSNQSFIIEFTDFKSSNYSRVKLVIVEPMFIKKSTNQPASSGKFNGLIVATLPLASITGRFVAPVKASQNGHAYLIDNEFKVLFSPDISLLGKSFLNKTKRFPSFQQVLKRMTSRKTSFDDYIYLKFNETTKKFSSDKQKQLIAYTPFRFGNGSWSMGVWAPEADAVINARSAKNKLFLLLGLITTVLLTGSGYILYIFSRSARAIQKEIDIRTSELRESETKFRRIAETLQSSFIKPVPEIKEIDLWVGYESAYEAERVGGDLYDIFELEDNSVAILVGDVSGKGVEAAGLTETIRSSVRTITYINSSLSYVMEKTNDALLHQFKDGDFITALFLIFNRKTGSIKLVSAGHPPPIITNKKSQYLKVENNFPLGLFKTSYKESKLELKRGNNIILYTDGLIEARRGAVYFGDNEIFKSLEKVKYNKSRVIVEELLKAASDFEKGRLRDDVVLISFRFT